MELNMRYTKIYKFMEMQLMLGGNDLRLFALIYSFHEAGKSCFASIQNLTKQLSSSRRSILRSIDALEQMGLINVSKSDSNGKLLDITVNESGIYRRVAELAAGGAVAAADGDEDEDEQPTGTYGSEGADGNDFNHARSEGAYGGEGADGNEGAYGNSGAYGSNSTHARGGVGRSQGDRGRIPKYASSTAEEALCNALCRTYGADLEQYAFEHL